MGQQWLGTGAWQQAHSRAMSLGRSSQQRGKDPALLLGFVTQDSLQPRLRRRSCPFPSLRWVFPHQLSHACAGTKNEKLKDLHQLEGCVFFWVGFTFQLPGSTGAKASTEEEEGDRATWEALTFSHSTNCKTAPSDRHTLQEYLAPSFKITALRHTGVGCLLPD